MRRKNIFFMMVLLILLMNFTVSYANKNEDSDDFIYDSIGEEYQSRNDMIDTILNDHKAVTSKDDEWTYDPTGKIDPFKPLLSDTTTQYAVNEKEENRCEVISPLQNYDLSQLKVSGIVLAESGNRGLIQTPTEKGGYIVREGNLVGNNCGIVIDINEDRVIIEEIVKNDFDKDVIKRSELVMENYLQKE